MAKSRPRMKAVRPRLRAAVFALALLVTCAHAAKEEFEVSGHDAIDHSHVDHSYYTILFLMVTVGIGGLVHETLHYFHSSIPYTVCILVLGMLVGAAKEAFDFGELGQSMERWGKIDPHMLLYSFLPALLFGDGCTINFHLIKKTFGQILLLACPGVLLGSFLTACVAKFVLPYGWSWDLSMAFGSILAATDPVAVVALLKAVGASPKLTMLIAGESLLNDGTAVVIFSLFLRMIQGERFDGPAIVEFAAKVSLGGPAVGLACGLLCILLLNFSDDSHVEVAYTVSFSYLSFYIAESIAGVSGVLSTVTFAVTFAAYAWPYVKNHHVTHEIWHFVEFSFNTVLFILSGFIIGMQLHQYLGVYIKGEEFAYLVVLYIFAILIRSVMFALFFPILQQLGYGVTLKECAVMVWGGLRGAIGLALAIVIEHEPKVEKKDSIRIFFFVGGIAVMTMLINATTAKALMVKLGMTKETYAEVQVYKDMRRRISSDLYKFYMKFKFVEMFNMHNPSVVKNTVSAIELHQRVMNGEVDDVEEIIHERAAQLHDVGPREPGKKKVAQSFLAASGDFMALFRRSAKKRREMSAKKQTSFEADVNSAEFLLKLVNDGRLIKTSEVTGLDEVLKEIVEDPGGEMMTAVRSIFISMIRKSYWEMVENGSLPEGGNCTILTNACDFAQDYCTKGVADWMYIQHFMVPNASLLRLIEWIKPLSKLPAGSRLFLSLKRFIDHFKRSVTWEDTVHLASAYVEAHVRARVQIVSYLGKDSTADTLEEKRICWESKLLCAVAESIIDKARANQPGVAQRVHTEQMCEALLHQQVKMINTLQNQGLLTAAVAKHLLNDVQHDHHSLSTLEWGSMFYEKTGNEKAAVPMSLRKKNLAKVFQKHENTNKVFPSSIIKSENNQVNTVEDFYDGWNLNCESDVGSSLKWYADAIKETKHESPGNGHSLSPDEDMVQPYNNSFIQDVGRTKSNNLVQTNFHQVEKLNREADERRQAFFSNESEVEVITKVDRAYKDITDLFGLLHRGRDETIGNHVGLFGRRVLITDDQGVSREIFDRRRRSLKMSLGLHRKSLQLQSYGSDENLDTLAERVEMTEIRSIV